MLRTPSPAVLGAVLAALSAAACAPESPSDGATTEAAGDPAGAAAGGTRSAPPGDRTGAAPGSGPIFADATAEWGLDFVHDAGFSADKQLPETMGGGGALLDADADGDLDVYLVQSGPLPVGIARAERPAAAANRLYANDGRGALADASAAAADAAHRGYGMGVAVGDADGDGSQDLFVTNLGPDALLANDGRARFRDATTAAGIDDARWTAGATFFDADADGDLDLYVTAYVEVDLEQPSWCGRREPGWRSYCHPDHYPGLQDRFWRNGGDGRFEDATAAAGLADSFGKGLGAIAGDYDGDGDLDLYVANDSVENRFWRNRGDGTFDDDTLLTGTGVNRQGATEAGMGLASGDVDGDGDLDLFVTNFDHESNTLYRNEGDGLFRDATVRTGLEAASRMPVGFGCVLEDLDGDGDLDLAVANGHIIDNIELYDDAQTWRQRPQLFANDGSGAFTELAEEGGALTARPLVGRGLFSGDLDGDGDLDLLLTQCGGPARLLANRRGGRFLVLAGLPSGTRVEARLDGGATLEREAGPQPSYFGACAPAVSIALGPASVEALSVRPPGAARSTPLDLPGPAPAAGPWRLRARLGPGGWTAVAE